MSKNNPSHMPPSGKYSVSAPAPTTSETETAMAIDSPTMGPAGSVVGVPEEATVSPSGPAVIESIPAKTEVTDPFQDPLHPPPGESASARVVPDVTPEPALPNASPSEVRAATQEAIVANRGISSSPNVPEREPGDGTTHIDAITAKIEPGKQYRVKHGTITAVGAGDKRYWAEGETVDGLADDDMDQFLKAGAIELVPD